MATVAAVVSLSSWVAVVSLSLPPAVVCLGIGKTGQGISGHLPDS
jgi:hypothetical protein